MGLVSASCRLPSFEMSSHEACMSSMTTAITHEVCLNLDLPKSSWKKWLKVQVKLFWTSLQLCFLYQHQHEEVNAARSGDHL